MMCSYNLSEDVASLSGEVSVATREFTDVFPSRGYTHQIAIARCAALRCLSMMMMEVEQDGSVQLEALREYSDAYSINLEKKNKDPSLFKVIPG